MSLVAYYLLHRQVTLIKGLNKIWPARLNIVDKIIELWVNLIVNKRIKIWNWWVSRGFKP